MGAQPYGNTEIITPTLSLAADGTTFTNAVCNTPVCSASRTSLLTGRMPSQHGVHDWLSNGNGCGQRVVNFSAAETFYTDRLAESGFDQIGLSGKFHLGNSEQALHGYNWWQFVHQSGGGSYIEDADRRQRLVRDAQGIRHRHDRRRRRALRAHARQGAEMVPRRPLHRAALAVLWQGRQGGVDASAQCGRALRECELRLGAQPSIRRAKLHRQRIRRCFTRRPPRVPEGVLCGGDGDGLGDPARARRAHRRGGARRHARRLHQ